MSKRLVLKLAVMVAALSAVTLLQGCGGEDGVEIGGAWMPVGAGTLPMMVLGAGAGGGAAGMAGGQTSAGGVVQ